MNDRSSRAAVRNPVLALGTFKALQTLPQPTRQALADLLWDLGYDAQDRADKCWAKHKAPMAAYWKAVAVYARHISRAVRKALPIEEDTTEPDIIINGTKLTPAQAMAVRVAVDSFKNEMNTPGALGDDQHGETMRIGYRCRLGEVTLAMLS